MIGIYFLKLDDKIVYVGQSVDVRTRIKQHRDKKFDSYELFECSKDNLNSLEAHYILIHNPILNQKKYEIIIGGTKKKEHMKMLQVENETHEKAKLKALEKKMSIKAYIKMLVDKDK